MRDVPRGTITEHFYASRIIGDRRNYYVYTPPNYDPRRRERVLQAIPNISAKYDVFLKLYDDQRRYREAMEELLEVIRLAGDGYRPRLVFTSSIAVFGAPFPEAIGDEFFTTPLTSYGTQKATGELLLNDYSRKGFVDGIGIRLPTICVRPGKPNAGKSTLLNAVTNASAKAENVARLGCDRFHRQPWQDARRPEEPPDDQYRRAGGSCTRTSFGTSAAPGARSATPTCSARRPRSERGRSGTSSGSTASWRTSSRAC